ncbi:hypothetical protein QBC38DRAFT_451582 [Podospora fimiseda]|uniref:Uncharacterized protein n=1 Tax=Podospora fimiseda TaxID=252190 RepID=A0AAN7BYD2_9PEZI|nr:hypothetical protein QBC38DRAFT_451582 [Podospora fimiseda]
MNSDSVMSDQPLATPSSVSDAPSSQPVGIKPPSWDTPKFREEYQEAKLHLLHPEFSSSSLPDPVTMRPIQSRLPGEDPATIQRLQVIVQNAEAKAQSEAAAPWPQEVRKCGALICGGRQVR